MIHLTTNLVVDNDFVSKYDSYLSRGLSCGLGDRDGQMCIEAAICASLGLPHSDNPKCVAESVREYKIALNDSAWSSPEARAKGLRDLGLAQLGSLDSVNSHSFIEFLIEKHIRVLIPTLLREKLIHTGCLKAADRCERDGDLGAIADAVDAIGCIDYECVVAARYLYMAAKGINGLLRKAHDVAVAARSANYQHHEKDKYLLLSAKLALETLEELGSPGCKLL